MSPTWTGHWFGKRFRSEKDLLVRLVRRLLEGEAALLERPFRIADARVAPHEPDVDGPLVREALRVRLVDRKGLLHLALGDEAAPHLVDLDGRRAGQVDRRDFGA